MSAMPSIASEPVRRNEPTRCATSRPEQVKQTEQPYSITSSARCRRNQGTSRPSTLAVLKLMISSNLLGRSIGRSPGISCHMLPYTRKTAPLAVLFGSSFWVDKISPG